MEVLEWMETLDAAREPAWLRIDREETAAHDVTAHDVTNALDAESLTPLLDFGGLDV